MKKLLLKFLNYMSSLRLFCPFVTECELSSFAAEVMHLI